MRFAATSLVLVSFIGLAVFSVAFMGATEHHANNFSACVGSLTQGTVCPQNNPWEAAIFHLGAFKFFSNSTLSSNSLTLTIYFLAALVLILTFLSVHPFLPSPASASLVSFRKSFETSFQPFKKKLNLWHSLHENSPAPAVTGFQLSVTS